MRRDEFPIVEEYCKDKIVEELEKVKAEIEEEKLDVDLDIGNETIYNNAINDVLAILDKHIKENKQ